METPELGDVRERLNALGKLHRNLQTARLLFLRAYIHYQLGLYGEVEAALTKLQAESPSLASVPVLLAAATAERKKAESDRSVPQSGQRPRRYDDLPRDFGDLEK